MVEIVLPENLGEDIFGQNVLDQHLAHIGIGNARIDCFLGMFQKVLPCLAKFCVVPKRR